MSFKQDQEYLLNLCRFCGKQANTKIMKKVRQRFCKKVQDEIFIFYGLDILIDTDDHPKVMRCHC